jgi:hypothetical protein
MLWMDGPAAATPITHYDGSFDNLQHPQFDIVNMAHNLRQQRRAQIPNACPSKPATDCDKRVTELQ